MSESVCVCVLVLVVCLLVHMCCVQAYAVQLQALYRAGLENPLARRFFVLPAP